MKTAYLALGSNLGDRAALLAEALRRLHHPGTLEISRVSSVYETAPIGVTDQPEFLNLAAEVKTVLSPEEVLATCLATETALGRVRRERWGPRTIDIDLLWYEGEQRTGATLTLPHPRMAERAFVLVPLAEIAPALVIGGMTIADLGARVSAVGLKKIGPLSWASASATSA